MGKSGIERAVAALVWTTRMLSTVTLIVAVILNFANVVGRYAFSSPISWAEEVMLFLMVGIVFLGIVPVSRDGAHIRMDVVVNMLPARSRRAVELFGAVLEIAVMIIIVVLAVPVIRQLAMFDQRSQAAQFPLAIPQALVPIGFGLAALVTLRRFVETWRSPVDRPPGPASHGAPTT